MMERVNNHKSKSILFYVIYSAVIALLLFIGLSGNIHAAHVNDHQQYQHQNRPVLVKKVKLAKVQTKHKKGNWFRDGLSSRDYKARAWISQHESGNRWNVLSYGGRCIGFFQLDPHYLGYKHGHVNLNHQHQVKVADRYAKVRYGGWVNAKRFWQAHHWY